jgi:hypothetical protein
MSLPGVLTTISALWKGLVFPGKVFRHHHHKRHGTDIGKISESVEVAADLYRQPRVGTMISTLI